MESFPEAGSPWELAALWVPTHHPNNYLTPLIDQLAYVYCGCNSFVSEAFLRGYIRYDGRC